MEHICPVCNYNDLLEPPYDSEGYGSDEICPCCGFQFGYDDFPDQESGMIRWREQWIKDGCNWFSKSRVSPRDWDADAQLRAGNLI